MSSREDHVLAQLTVPTIISNMNSEFKMKEIEFF